MRVANFLAAIVIARLGGALLFGIYATTLAYATIAAMLAENGLGISTVRTLAGDRDRASEGYTRYAVAKTLLFVPMVVGLAAIGFYVRLSPMEWAIGSMIVLRTMLQHYCQVNVTVLKALDRMRAIGPIQGVHAAALMVLLAICYVQRTSVYVVIASLVLAQCLELAIEVSWIRRIPVHFVRVSLRGCLRLALSSTYAGITLSLSAAIIRLDVIVLSTLAGSAVAGVFAAAQSVIVIVYLLGALLASVLFPDMARLANLPAEFRRYTRHWVSIILWVTIPGTILAILLGPAALRLLFGKAFVASGSLLAIMLVASPAIVLNAVLLHRTFALHHVRASLGVYIGGLVMAFALNVAAARAFGAAGISIAVVIREYLVLLAFLALSNVEAGGTEEAKSTENAVA